MTAANQGRRRLTPFQAAVFDGYAAGKRPAVIAARWGATPTPPPAWLARIPALQARCRYGRFA